MNYKKRREQVFNQLENNEMAIVFAGNQIKDGFWVLLSVFLSLFLSILMVKFNFIQLTFPFVLASCVTLLFKKLFLIQKQIGH